MTTKENTTKAGERTQMKLVVLEKNLSWSEVLKAVKEESETEFVFVARPLAVSGLLPSEHTQWLLCAGKPSDFENELSSAEVQACMTFNYGKRDQSE